jgi:hypothetical protein
MALSNSATASHNGIAVNTTGAASPVNIYQNLSKMPSILSPLLEGIIAVYDPVDIPDSPNQVTPTTNEKITFNSVKIYAEEIREHSGLMALIENVIDGIDSSNPRSKDRFLWAIHQKYKRCKSKLLLASGIDASDNVLVKNLICENADLLIDNVSEEIFSTVGVGINCEVEILQSAQKLIVCFGFVNCKILERPDDYQ